MILKYMQVQVQLREAEEDVGLWRWRFENLRHSNEAKRLRKNALAKARYHRKRAQEVEDARAYFLKEREEAERFAREMRELADEGDFEDHQSFPADDNDGFDELFEGGRILSGNVLAEENKDLVSSCFREWKRIAHGIDEQSLDEAVYQSGVKIVPISGPRLPVEEGQVMEFMGKRARRASSNPFESDVKDLLVAADATPVVNTLSQAVTKLNTELTCSSFFDDCDIQTLKAMRAFTREGKHTHEVKVAMLVAMAPLMKNLAVVSEKCINTHDEICKRYSKIIWQEVIKRSEMRKFNMDILRMILDDALKNKGVDMDEDE
jgi:hypothetical protein